jgi:septum formation protein
MIYLASQSPRRTELLRQIGVKYEVRVADVDESRLAGETPEEYVCRIARSKAGAVFAQLAGTQKSLLVLAADTTIELDGDIIGKPTDREHCQRILRQLSGREHVVLSAVALATRSGLDCRLSRNQVRFKTLGEHEIDAYCASAEPMDKAGAYAIQGMAAVFVERLVGSYSAVMGLPLYETAELLRDAGIEILNYDD